MDVISTHGRRTVVEIGHQEMVPVLAEIGQLKEDLFLTTEHLRSNSNVNKSSDLYLS